ncbi:GNAT family N-acetyltransferase [Streptomyces sp. NRRL B-24484]|uniref:GNAT family N-acetyltransferase n=1 Tax=Streptomyces sp. NRRL B-24484 TaxID=1463833 RepID=UPI000693B7FD|nr:GNAT family protein [Streptomyces sp. NRRL B-24484]
MTAEQVRTVRQVRLTGPRLAIREFRLDPEDVRALHAVLGDPETVRHLAYEVCDEEECADQIELSLDEAEEDPRTVYRLAVAPAERDGGAPPIGQAVLELEGTRAASLGCVLRRDTWGRGYAAEVLALLCGFGFGTLGLHRFAARVDPENAASVRVLTRAGFRPEGRIRHDLLVRGEWRDSLLFSLLEDEWLRSAAARGWGEPHP